MATAITTLLEKYKDHTKNYNKHLLESNVDFEDAVLGRSKGRKYLSKSKEQDSTKVFRPAFNKMLNLYLEPQGIYVPGIAQITNVSESAIYAFENGISSILSSNLEKILLSSIVCDESLNYFNKEVTTLLEKYRKNTENDEEHLLERNAELEDAVLGGSKCREHQNKFNITFEQFEKVQKKWSELGAREKSISALI